MITMIKKHIDLIKQGKKTTTLRSLKEVYPLPPLYYVGNYEACIKFTSRVLVDVSDRDIWNTDIGNYLIVSEVTKSEGYEYWSDVIEGLKKMRHKLPKRMWLYKFEVVK